MYDKPMLSLDQAQAAITAMIADYDKDSNRRKVDMAVVDDRLRVRGLSGLRVADASIMPVITSGNTNAPSIMVGEKCADLILSERNR